jgi:hypothetical protein
LKSSDDTLRIPLPRRPFGIEKFRVEGTMEREPAHARWDGSCAIVSTLLCERVELTMAVDEALAESGAGPQFSHPAFRRSPEEYMLAVLTCCDDIRLAEFEIRGHHHVITA